MDKLLDCSKCKKMLPTSAFSPQASCKRGFQTQCRKCRNEKYRKRYQNGQVKFQSEPSGLTLRQRMEIEEKQREHRIRMA